MHLSIHGLHIAIKCNIRQGYFHLKGVKLKAMKGPSLD